MTKLMYPFEFDAHAPKRDPQLLGDDVAFFARLESHLHGLVDDLEARLRQLRRAPGGSGQAALDRDLEIHRLTARLRLLRRFGVDLCLGHVVDHQETRYIGRLGILDQFGEPLLYDWRTPAAEPFFGANHGDPMGLVSRRRYRWRNRHIIDYWDEVFRSDLDTPRAVLDDQSAFIASLNVSRSTRMHDVLATIQADQNAIIRADAGGTLVVDGGPGTGKTVVALHRTAYLLHANPRMHTGNGGVLFIGPSPTFLDYVADILPSLGEDGVKTGTLADLVPEGRFATADSDQYVSGIKSDGRMPAAVEESVRLREIMPTEPISIETFWGDALLTPVDWAEAWSSAEPSATHNEAREDIWQSLLNIIATQLTEDSHVAHDDPWDDEESDDDWDDPDQFDAYGRDGVGLAEELIDELTEHPKLNAVLDAAWPLLEPSLVVRELWQSPALLQQCAPWLSAAEITALHQAANQDWTFADLPLLDAAHLRVGNAQAALRRRQAATEAAAERAHMDDVVTQLIATDDSEMQVMSMLRGQDLRSALANTADFTPHRDTLAGPFAHIVVDEAQELTGAQWQMLVKRNPTGSFTVVGDRTQARHGFQASWQQQLTAYGHRRITVRSLSVNYRTPAEVMNVAEPVIRAVLPDANVPQSIKHTNVPVRYGPRAHRDEVLTAWLSTHPDGVACIIGDRTFSGSDRVRSLAPSETKGLEFDLVILVDDESLEAGGTVEAAVDRYVAMTRATQELVILS